MKGEAAFHAVKFLNARIILATFNALNWKVYCRGTVGFLSNKNSLYFQHLPPKIQQGKKKAPEQNMSLPHLLQQLPKSKKMINCSQCV